MIWKWLDGYGIVAGGCWTIDTEGGHVVDSVSRIRRAMDTEYGKLKQFCQLIMDAHD